MRMRHAAVVAGLALGLMSGTAKAAVIINIDQVGADVDLVGSGSVNLSALNLYGSALYLTTAIRGNTGYVTGSGGNSAAYYGFSGPSAIGNGTSLTGPSSASGDIFGLNSVSLLYLSRNYASLSPLAFSETFTGYTISSLGLTNGTYNYSATRNGVSDSITINIGPVSPVPLPASAPMFGAALLALGAVGYGVKRKKAAAAA